MIDREVGDRWPYAFMSRSDPTWNPPYMSLDSHSHIHTNAAVAGGWFLVTLLVWVLRLQNILRRVNSEGRKLSILRIGSSHTAGAGVGSFLRGHPTLKVRS